MFESGDNMLDQLWVEKFRPRTIDDVVLNADQKEFVERCLAKQEIPHMAFFGPPGSGKCHAGDETITIYVED